MGRSAHKGRHLDTAIGAHDSDRAGQSNGSKAKRQGVLSPGVRLKAGAATPVATVPLINTPIYGGERVPTKTLTLLRNLCKANKLWVDPFLFLSRARRNRVPPAISWRVGRLGVPKSRNDPATCVAFRLRQKVVIPLPVCVGSEIRMFPRFPDNPYVTLLPGLMLHRVVLFRIRVDLSDRRLSGDPPMLLQVPDMRDVLMRTLVVRLVDTCYLMLCHMLYLAFISNLHWTPRATMRH